MGREKSTLNVGFTATDFSHHLRKIANLPNTAPDFDLPSFSGALSNCRLADCMEITNEEIILAALTLPNKPLLKECINLLALFLIFFQLFHFFRHFSSRLEEPLCQASFEERLQ